ncbi:MAG TPA: hemerythrin domain-containing protein [Gemmatimonadales bacterium]|nr:hemerythrin domain-containing protein [Gemmatimonadales bacterium]
MEFSPPRSLEIEHEALHADLVALTKLPGKVGDAARLVATRLHEHFALEEELAVPPLALLAPLARGGASPAMRSILAKTDRLKAEMPRMLAEHRAILEAVGELAKAAEEEGRLDATAFAERLRLHAATEEEVLYPAAILVGEYLKRVHSA